MQAECEYVKCMYVSIELGITVPSQFFNFEFLELLKSWDFFKNIFLILYVFPSINKCFSLLMVICIETYFAFLNKKRCNLFFFLII